MKIDNEALSYFEKNYDSAVAELSEFLKIPSVSTDPEHEQDIKKAANYLVERLTSLGFDDVKAYETSRHPIVCGHWKKAHVNAPTILIYGHYDVQPPDPLDEWHSGPFEPVVKNEYLVARGSSDMKGQIMATIFAIEAILKTSQLPVNIKFILEGEEEIGSPSLDKFIETHTDILKADIILNPDAGMISPERPTIVNGLRGLAYFELKVFGPNHDLHSGQFGGAVDNPAIVLSKLISKLRDDNGKITLPNFYDRVRPLTDSDRKKIAGIQMPDSRYLELTGAPALFGEQGYTVPERVGARPTLDVNGIYSGFIGEGSKTIIPAFAKAKISCRLVPDQDPQEIFHSFEVFCKENLPDTITYEIFNLSGAPAYLAENAPGTKNLVEAYKTIWNTEVVFKREGGSIPVATTMKNLLGVDSILTGFGLPGDLIHSPNERLHLPTWKKGIEALILFFSSYSE